VAIIGPADLPKVLKIASENLKQYILLNLGHPNIRVELTEDQLESLIRVVGSFIAQYFARTPLITIYCAQMVIWFRRNDGNRVLRF